MSRLTTMIAAAALAVGSAWGTETVTVDEVSNHYPWDGKVDCAFVLDGLNAGCTYKGVFTLTVKKDGTAVRRTVTNDFPSVDGTYTNTFDTAALFGEGFYPNGGLKVDLIKEELGGVQLWENGPYWAECNVGASQPEEYGYYFWWGDTVGYTRSGGTWNSFDSRYEGVTWVSSAGTQMGSSPFDSSTCPTYGKNNSQLQSAGYIDATGNLVAAHDAATAHLGAPWRMPTDAEWSALISNCTIERITTNGVSGRLVTGTGAYSSRKIFLPAAGFGSGSDLGYPGSGGYFWSSTPPSDDSDRAWSLNVASGGFGRYYNRRYFGQSVRPVRGFAQ